MKTTIPWDTSRNFFFSLKSKKTIFGNSCEWDKSVNVNTKNKDEFMTTNSQTSEKKNSTKIQHTFAFANVTIMWILDHIYHLLLRVHICKNNIVDETKVVCWKMKFEKMAKKA